MRSVRTVGVALALVLVMPAMVWAQCAGGGSKVAALGIALVECDCTVGAADPAAWRFTTPPRIVTVAQGSAADGVLQQGDVILQVGDRAITTPEGAAAFARAKNAGPTQMLIQRNGRTRWVALRPGELCPNAARIIAAAPGTVSRVRAAEAAGAATSVARAPAQGGTRVPLMAATTATAAGAPRVQDGRLLAATVPGGTWIGIAFSCSDCTVDRPNGRWHFASPPQVYSVESGSPAYAAGLRRGDVLTHVDGVSITSASGGQRWEQVKPGQTVRVTYRRGNATHQTRITAGEPRTPVPVMAPTVAYRAAVDSSAAAMVRDYERLISQQAEREAQVLRRLVERQVATDTASRRQFDAVLREYQEQQESMRRERQARTDELLRRLQKEVILDVKPSVVLPTPAQRLRFSGSIGGADVEVRGQSSVVVSERADELIITTSDATIRIKVPRRD